MGSMGQRRKTGLHLFLLCFLVAGQPGPGAAETLYAKCSADTDCTPPGSKCIDYGSLYKSGNGVKVCDCEKPALEKAGEDGCSCAIANPKQVYRRWTWSTGGAANPKGTKFTFPAADVTKDGCYLEMGEVCALDKDKDGAAAPHTICKSKYYCNKLTADFGMCRYGGDSALLLPSRLLVTSSVPVALLLLLLHTPT